MNATLWIRSSLIEWLKGSPETREAQATMRARQENDDDAPLFDQAALNAAVLAEREACAKVCESPIGKKLASLGNGGEQLGALIRARGTA